MAARFKMTVAVAGKWINLPYLEKSAYHTPEKSAYHATEKLLTEVLKEVLTAVL